MSDILSAGVMVIFISFCFTVALYHLSIGVIGVKCVSSDLWLFTCIVVPIQLAFNFFFLYIPEAEAFFSWVWVITFFIHIVLLSVLLNKRYSKRFAKTFCAVAIAQFLITTVENIIEILMYRMSYIDIEILYTENYFLANVIYICIPHALMVVCSFLLASILKKVRFTRYFSHLFSSGMSSTLMVITSFILMNINTVSLYTDPELIDSNFFIIASFALIIVALFVLQLIAMFAENRERIEAQQQIILQQNAYVHALEDLHNDFRNFRHDLRNLLSGITLQVAEGDLQGAKKYLQNTSQYFEHKIGNEIKQMNVLGQIKIPSVKSLLAVKLAVAKQNHIGVTVEILYPVTYIEMEEQDFNRCLGVLLDNAIEAALSEADPEIQIIILQEYTELRIVLSNSSKNCPPIRDIFKRNFSTKGSKRGLGLSSYRQIVDSCPNTSNRCFWKDGMFSQELRIQSVMKGVQVNNPSLYM